MRLGFPAFLLAAAMLFADVRLPAPIAGGMVVQRNVPVHIWGWAHPGEAVSVTFRGETRTVAAGEFGFWSVRLSPGAAGGPFEMSIQGRNTIVLRDVLAGDVWLAAGQSNMEWPVRWSAEPDKEIAAARHPRIRLFRAMHRVSDYPLEDAWGKTWTECSPESVADFSAVAYHFGRFVREKHDVPIGLIQSAWGGTPLDAWTPLRDIAADPALSPSIAEWARMMEDYPLALLRFERSYARWKASGSPPREEPPRPRGPDRGWKPGSLYNAMIAPLTRYPIRGVIWYQGESNTSAERAPVYGRLFRAMIGGWRRAWGHGAFPFLFVQLAAYRATPDSMWPEVREAQREALSLANTAMAVTIDIGEADDIHPKNKREVGRRLALAARAISYGEPIGHSGPLFRRATHEGAALRLWFDHAEGGLVARGGALRGFEIAGAEGVFYSAEALVDGVTVLVRHSGVPAPRSLRYAWKDYPDATLYNAAGLPAAPFRFPLH